MDTFIPSTTGEWVSEKYATLAEIVHDYDHNLELRWIPPDKRTRDDKKPYVIWDTVSNRPVMFAGETEIPEQILARLFTIDNVKGDVLKALEAHEAALMAFRQKEWLNRMEEAHDLAQFMHDSPLNYVKMNGKKYDDQRRVIGSARGEKHIT